MFDKKERKYPHLPRLPLAITKPNAEITKIVNDFVDRFYKHEYTLGIHAVDVPVIYPEESGNLAQFLLNAMDNYLITKDKPDANSEWACKLFALITQAYGAKVIDTGDAGKLKNCAEENQRLRDVQVKLEAEILRLKSENDELHKILDVFGAESDVTANTEK